MGVRSVCTCPDQDERRSIGTALQIANHHGKKGPGPRATGDCGAAVLCLWPGRAGGWLPSLCIPYLVCP